MMIKAWWQQRRAHRRAVNDALADADQQLPSQLDRWERERWSDEMSDRLLKEIQAEERRGPLTW